MVLIEQEFNLRTHIFLASDIVNMRETNDHGEGAGIYTQVMRRIQKCKSWRDRHERASAIRDRHEGERERERLHVVEGAKRVAFFSAQIELRRFYSSADMSSTA